MSQYTQPLYRVSKYGTVGHRWTIHTVLYWNTITIAGIVLVLDDFSQLNNTNNKPISNFKKIRSHSALFNKLLVKKHYKQQHITCFLRMHNFNFPISFKDSHWASQRSTFLLFQQPVPYYLKQPSSTEWTYRQLRKLIFSYIFLQIHLNKELC